MRETEEVKLLGRCKTERVGKRRGRKARKAKRERESLSLSLLSPPLLSTPATQVRRGLHMRSNRLATSRPLILALKSEQSELQSARGCAATEQATRFAKFVEWTNPMTNRFSLTWASLVNYLNCVQSSTKLFSFHEKSRLATSRPLISS